MFLCLRSYFQATTLYIKCQVVSSLSIFVKFLAKVSNDGDSEEVFRTLETIFVGVEATDNPAGDKSRILSKGTFAALKGKYRQAINRWKAEMASSEVGSETRIRTARAMIYSTLALTGNLDEVAGLVDFVANLADAADDDDVVRVDVEKCLVDIFRQLLTSDGAVLPAAHTGSCVTSQTGNGDRLFIRTSDLRPPDHFLLEPKTFIKIFAKRKQVIKNFSITKNSCLESDSTQELANQRS